MLSMSSLPSLSSASSALATLNVHAHGHKKGSQVGSTTDAASPGTTAKGAASSVQNLFSSLLQSLEQVIPGGSAAAAAFTPATNTSATAGTAGAPATGAVGASPATAAASATTTAAQSGGTAGSTQSGSSLLQNYLNTLTHTLRTDGTQLNTLAGPSVSARA